MRSSVVDRRRWLLPALGLAVFLAAFAGAYLFTLSGDVLLVPLRKALGPSRYTIAAARSTFRFPLAVELGDAVLTTPRGNPITLDTAVAGWDMSGLFRGLPGHLRLVRGQASIDIQTSPVLWNPGRGRLSIANLSSTDLSDVAPAFGGWAFRIDSAAARWSRSAGGALSGSGTVELGTMRFPVPAPDSPVREAALDNVRLNFTLLGGDLQVSSLSGRYEGSEVDGTGVITRIANPSASTITFHLRIRNPLEGKVAVLFDLVAKNAKNANLRVTGPLLSPAGEFQFF